MTGYGDVLCHYVEYQHYIKYTVSTVPAIGVYQINYKPLCVFTVQLRFRSKFMTSHKWNFTFKSVPMKKELYNTKVMLCL